MSVVCFPQTFLTLLAMDDWLGYSTWHKWYGQRKESKAKTLGSPGQMAVRGFYFLWAMGDKQYKRFFWICHHSVQAATSTTKPKQKGKRRKSQQVGLWAQQFLASRLTESPVTKRVFIKSFMWPTSKRQSKPYARFVKAQNESPTWFSCFIASLAPDEAPHPAFYWWRIWGIFHHWYKDDHKVKTLISIQKNQGQFR